MSSIVSALGTLSKAVPLPISQMRKPRGILGATQDEPGRADLEARLVPCPTQLLLAHHSLAYTGQQPKSACVESHQDGT